MVRYAGGYVVPGADGPFVGRHHGGGQRTTSASSRPSSSGLAASAARAFPGISPGSRRRAPPGVRYGAPDGLPLVGASSRPGVFLALGARRNGWLLAPLIAEGLSAAISGGESPAFRPDRFVSSA